MTRTWSLFLGCCLFVSACVADSDDPADTTTTDDLQVIVEGDPCNTQLAECTDSTSLLLCSEGAWVLDDCSTYCAGLGEGVTSPGCDTVTALGFATQLCECEPPADGCHPNQGRCESDDVLEWCTPSYAWTTTSCMEVCAADLLLSLGCEAIGDQAACLCTNVGLPCTDEPTTCASLTSLSTCQDGLWAVVDCGQSCGGAGSCDPAADGGASCVCG